MYVETEIKSSTRQRKINLILKRLSDVLLSFTGLVLLCPFFLVIGIIIKCTSDGPVFFLQERIGYRGKVLKIIKFRTMIVNAEHVGDGICIYEKTDPRVTKIGRFLRSTSLDELPQLFNVLKGEMSLVGPRPPAAYHPYNGYEDYPEWAKKRFTMRPGITGLVQVKLRDSSWDEKMLIDIEYIDRFSVLFDMKILLKTVLIVLQGKAT